MTAQKFDDAQSLISYVLDNGPNPDDDAAAVVNGFLRCEQYAHVLDWYMLSVPETLDDSDIVGTIRANIGLLEPFDAYEDVANLVGVDLY